MSEGEESRVGVGVRVGVRVRDWHRAGIVMKRADAAPQLCHELKEAFRTLNLTLTLTLTPDLTLTTTRTSGATSLYDSLALDTGPSHPHH